MSASAMDAASRTLLPQTPRPSPPLMIRLFLLWQLYMIKITTKFATIITSRLFPSLYPPADLKIRYPSRPTLEIHLYIPRSSSSSSFPSSTTTTKYPLYISIHGGGFAMGSPIGDALLSRKIADTANVVVANVSYRKTPTNTFPTPAFDITDQITLLLSDGSLPIDKHNVAIGGYSAGGNLALCVSQLDQFQGVFKAAVGFFPPLNFQLPVKEKLASRGIKRGPDPLAFVARAFDWGYIPSNIALDDPFLSPFFAPASRLPKNIFMLACEADLLSTEERAFASRISKDRFGALARATTIKSGNAERTVVRGEHIAAGASAAAGGGAAGGEVVFEMVKGARHGFTHLLSFGKKKGSHAMRVEDVMDRFSKWLGGVLWEGVQQQQQVAPQQGTTRVGARDDDVVAKSKKVKNKARRRN